jgi:O-antigen/teichoic acid export membrane protein
VTRRIYGDSASRRTMSTHKGSPEAGRRHSMFTSSMGMITGRVASMALGFAFWALAARLFAPAPVGLAAGVIAAMMLCTQLGALGVGSAFISLFPRYQHQPSVLLDTAITIAALGPLVAGGLFLLFSSVAFADLDVVAASAPYIGLFLAMCVLGTVNIVLDQISMALGQGVQVLSRNVLFGGVAAGALIVLAVTTEGVSSLQLFSLWVAAGVSACALGGFQLRRSPLRYRISPRIERTVGAGLIRTGLPNHALTLTERAPGLILPIVVTELLSPAQNAFWYTIWMMAWVVYIIPISMGIALFAEVSHHPESLATAVRSGVRSALGLGSAAAAGLALCATLVLGVLGDRYATEGSTPLRILLLALLPLTFVQVYFAMCRATRRLPEAILTGAVTGLAAVVSAALAAPPYGLAGMAWAWVAIQYLAGAWSLVRIRTLRAGGLDPLTASPAVHAPMPPDVTPAPR